MSMCNNKFVIICFDSNSQTSESIRSPKSPMVDLEVEEQEGSQGSPGTEEEREQECDSLAGSAVWQQKCLAPERLL